jgi:DNA-binding MarR family transcriptional regulator
MIDRLEKKGLIEPRANPEDRRGPIVVLTNGAAKKFPPLFESMAKTMEALVSSHSEKELDTLSDFFRKITLLWKDEHEQLQRRFRGKGRS